MLQPTGERFLPEMEGAYIAYEHWHRYLFATRFVQGKTVLDLASGEGYGSDLLATHAESVVGVDLDPDAVRHAGATYRRANLTFLCGPAEAIPIAGQHRFDVVTSFETLEHLTPQAQGQFLGEIRRLLKPGGLLLISTPNRLIYSDRNQHHNPFHLREFSQTEFVEFLTGSFRHVQMLSQRVYPGSFLWNLDRPTDQWAEYQIALEKGLLRPARADGKEQLYYVALCSDDPAATAPNSLLLDLSEVAIRGNSGHRTTLFVDRGDGFRAEEAYQLPLTDPESLELEFHLEESEDRPPRQLRWDPVEMRTCRVFLTNIGWQGADGPVHELDLARVSSNGIDQGRGGYRFDTLDPMLFLPIQGPLKTLIIKGRCEIDDQCTSMRRVDDLLRVTQDQLAAREQHLHNLQPRLAQAEGRSTLLGEQLRDLQNRLDAALAEWATVQVCLHRSEEQRAQLTRQMDAYEQERARMVAHLEAYEQERGELTGYLERYEAQRAQLSTCLHARLTSA